MNVSLKSKFSLQAVFLLCILSGFIFLSWYTFGYVAQARERVRVAQAELGQLDAEQREISEISRAYDEIEPLVTELERVLLLQEDKLAFIMLVERLAKEVGVLHVIEAVSKETEKDQKRQQNESLVFNINIFGGFSKTLQFMYLLENTDYYVTLEKIQITQGVLPVKGSSSGALPGKDDVKAQLAVRVYTQTQKSK